MNKEQTVIPGSREKQQHQHTVEDAALGLVRKQKPKLEYVPLKISRFLMKAAKCSTSRISQKITPEFDSIALSCNKVMACTFAIALALFAAVHGTEAVLREKQYFPTNSTTSDYSLAYNSSDALNDVVAISEANVTTDRVLMPSRQGPFKDMCSENLKRKRRLYRDDFSNEIFRWVTEDLISQTTWDTTRLSQVQKQTGHLPDFHRLPKDVISSFALKTCPIYSAEESSRGSINDPKVAENLQFCRNPLQHERVPASIYLPMNRVAQQNRQRDVRSLCHTVFLQWSNIVETCTNNLQEQNLISKDDNSGSEPGQNSGSGSGRSEVNIKDLRFDKCSFGSNQPKEYHDMLPLTAEDFPLTRKGYEILKHSNCVSPTLTRDNRVKGSVSNWVQNVMGGAPPHPVNDERGHYWKFFEQIVDLQIERKAYGQTMVSRIFTVPDLWGDFSIDRAADAVHNEFPGKWQRECIEDFLNKRVQLDHNVMPKRAEIDFISSVVSMANLNTWSIDTIAATSFAAKYYVGRIRPEEMAWKIHTGEVRDGVPTRIIEKVQSMNLRQMEDFTAYAEGCPRHPSWPAMHSVGSTMSLWMGVVCDLTPEQLRQAQLTDFAVAYSRSVAGVHYFDDNLVGLKLGYAIISEQLPTYLEKTYGSNPEKVRQKIRQLQFDWKVLESEFLKSKWRY